MERLNLGRNKLTIIKSNWFKCLENLKALDLHSNEIQSIDDDVFDKLVKLEKLDLNNNEFIKTEKLALFLVRNFNYFIKNCSKCERDFESMYCFLIINDNDYIFLEKVLFPIKSTEVDIGKFFKVIYIFNKDNKAKSFVCESNDKK